MDVEFFTSKKIVFLLQEKHPEISTKIFQKKTLKKKKKPPRKKTSKKKKMRASLLALLALLVLFVAGASVDALYIRYYYGSSTCNSSSTRVYLLHSDSNLGRCFNYNSTYTLTTESAILSKCNQTTAKFSYTSYSGTGCLATVRNSFVDSDEQVCQALSTVNGKNGSMRVYCSNETTTPSPTASSVSFSTTACAAVTCLLFIISILTF
jgi:hypothetical protein